MKRSILSITATVLLAFVIPQKTHAQIAGLKHHWSGIIGNTAWDDVGAICTDASGNFYVTGTFSGTVDFDPSSTGTYPLTSTGVSWNAYVCKFDVTGALQWAKSFDCGNTTNALDIAVDGSGNVYSVGWYSSATMDADPNAGTFDLINAGGSDAYLIKLSSVGDLVWAKRLGASEDDDFFGVDVAPDGSVVATGRFQLTTDLDPNAGTNNVTAQGIDIVVLKLDSDGNYLWAAPMGGAGDDAGGEVKVQSNGQVVTVGYYEGTADFDPETGSQTVTSTGTVSDIFISILDANGQFVSVGSFSGSGGEGAYGLALDANDNILITGVYSSTLDCNPSSAAGFNLALSGSNSMYMVKLSQTGSFLWGKRIASSSYAFGYDCAFDTDGNAYAVGDFAGNVDLDPGLGQQMESQGSASSHGLIVKLDANGALLYATTLEGSYTIYPTSMAVSNTGRVFVGGRLNDVLDADPNLGQQIYTSVAGSEDAFVIALDQCDFPTVSGTATIAGGPCDGCKIYAYVYPGGPGELWEKLDSTITDGAGFYTMNLPPDTNMVLQVRPEAGGFINCVPTYSGDVHTWSTAQHFVTQCSDNFISDIDVITFGSPAGTATISGYVQFAPQKMAEEDPIPLIDVVIERTPPGNVTDMVVTDANGYYEFQLVVADASPYYVRVSIPGLPVQAGYSVQVNPGDLLFDNLDYCVDLDTSFVESCDPSGIIHIGGKVGSLMVAPNPTSGSVAITIRFDDSVHLSLVDALGRAVVKQFMPGSGQRTTWLDLSAVPTGFYQVVATGPSGTSVERLIITHQ